MNVCPLEKLKYGCLSRKISFDCCINRSVLITEYLYNTHSEKLKVVQAMKLSRTECVLVLSSTALKVSRFQLLTIPVRYSEKILEHFDSFDSMFVILLM